MTLAVWRSAVGDRWPVEEGPGWLLVHGDCLDVMAAMPAKSCAVVLTDPPYEAEAHTEQRRQKGKATRPGGGDEFREVNMAPLSFGAITAAQRASVAALIANVAAHRAVAFCQAEAVGDWKLDFNAAEMPYRRAMPWVKPDAMPSLHGRWPGQGYESIVLAQHRSAPAAPVGGKAKTYTCSRDRWVDGAPHPTTKPIALMLDLVADFTDPGDLVVDPFCGSATTGIACVMLGRTFVGIERDAEFFAVACRRMRGEIARPRAEQPSLFGSSESRTV